MVAVAGAVPWEELFPATLTCVPQLDRPRTGPEGRDDKSGAVPFRTGWDRLGPLALGRADVCRDATHMTQACQYADPMTPSLMGWDENLRLEPGGPPAVPPRLHLMLTDPIRSANEFN